MPQSVHGYFVVYEYYCPSSVHNYIQIPELLIGEHYCISSEVLTIGIAVIMNVINLVSEVTI